MFPTLPGLVGPFRQDRLQVIHFFAQGGEARVLPTAVPIRAFRDAVRHATIEVAGARHAILWRVPQCFASSQTLQCKFPEPSRTCLCRSQFPFLQSRSSLTVLSLGFIPCTKNGHATGGAFRGSSLESEHCRSGVSDAWWRILTTWGICFSLNCIPNASQPWGLDTVSVQLLGGER